MFMLFGYKYSMNSGHPDIHVYGLYNNIDACHHRIRELSGCNSVVTSDAPMMNNVVYQNNYVFWYKEYEGTDFIMSVANH